MSPAAGHCPRAHTHLFGGRGCHPRTVTAGTPVVSCKGQLQGPRPLSLRRSGHASPCEFMVRGVSVRCDVVSAAGAGLAVSPGR